MQHGRVILPAFLTERSARTVLRDLYLGIQGSEYNAHLLVSKEPWEIDREAVKGNNLTRRCFIDCIDWLGTIRKFALSDDIFRKQFQIPFTCAANFIINARAYSSPVTKLTGFVISKSSPRFSLYFKDKMITLGIILPDIEGVMSLKCKADFDDEIEYRAYDFDGVQPFPYVNRIHPTLLEISDRALPVNFPNFTLIYSNASFSFNPKVIQSLTKSSKNLDCVEVRRI